MTKRLKVVNKARFLFSLTILILLCYFLINLTLNNLIVEGAETTEYIEIVVIEGDTLWDLAKKFGPETQDIRKSIQEICFFNGLSSSNIYPGETIKIPLME